MDYKNIINEALTDATSSLAEGRRWAVQALMDEGLDKAEADTMVRDYLEKCVYIFVSMAGGTEK